MKGLCPFHDEKSPSFHVTPVARFFHCLAGETEVLTCDGVRPIPKLAGGIHRVLKRYQPTGSRRPSRSYGVQRLHRITLTSESSGPRRSTPPTVIAGSCAVRGREALAPRGAHHRLALCGPSGDGIGASLSSLSDAFGVSTSSNERRGSSGSTLVAVVDHAGWVVQSVEETDRVEEVFCAEVEDGHAFVLEDNILTGNCFGCQEGGDVITFLIKIDGLGFSEAVERLADRYGIQLRYQEGQRPPRPRDTTCGPGCWRRTRRPGVLRRALAPPRRWPAGSSSPRAASTGAAATFGVGFAPRDGDALYRHLRQKGFQRPGARRRWAGAEGNRGHYDRFRGRLLWPIRETNGDVIGFGARRIFDDDRIDAKYLNTSETPIYKKSHVLYGIDLARRDIARGSQAVVVEGYTDVMACHLAGVPTAVATCGTAFGDDHGRVLRRLLQDHDEFRGEVIFTFDGDAAGQKAALRAFEGDQKFAGQTYVAVEPDGLDPCDLRLQRAMLPCASWSPAGCRSTASSWATWSPATTSTGPTGASTRSVRRPGWSPRSATASKVEAFSRELAGMVGVDIEDARSEVRRAATVAGEPTGQDQQRGRTPGRPPRPSARRRRRCPTCATHASRSSGRPSSSSCSTPRPSAMPRTWTATTSSTRPTARVGRRHRLRRPGRGARHRGLGLRLRDSSRTPAVAQALARWPSSRCCRQGAHRGYVDAHVFRLQEVTAMRRIAELKSRLQRTNPVDHATDYNRMFGELVALEQHRRTLREKAIGGDG